MDQESFCGNIERFVQENKSMYCPGLSGFIGRFLSEPNLFPTDKSNQL